MEQKRDIEKLAHELTYRRYLMSKGQVRDFFRNISIQEYIALHIIAMENETSDIFWSNLFAGFIRKNAINCQADVTHGRRIEGSWVDTVVTRWKWQ